MCVSILHVFTIFRLDFRTVLAMLCLVVLSLLFQILIMWLWEIAWHLRAVQHYVLMLSIMTWSSNNIGINQLNTPYGLTMKSHGCVKREKLNNLNLACKHAYIHSHVLHNYIWYLYLYKSYNLIIFLYNQIECTGKLWEELELSL